MLMLLACFLFDMIHLVVTCILVPIQKVFSRLFVSNLNVCSKYSPTIIKKSIFAEYVCTVFADPIYFLIHGSVSDKVLTVIINPSR